MPATEIAQTEKALSLYALTLLDVDALHLNFFYLSSQFVAFII